MTVALDTLQTLHVEIKNSIAHVTLNRPESKNAMNYQMVAELHALFTGWHDDRSIRAIVLTGADETFCAGGDIKEMRENPVPAVESAANLDAMLRAANEAAQVVIARVEGAALGGGLGLVCVADIAIASETAIMGLPEVRLGVAPAFISPFVIDRIGLTRARELMLTGRRFNGRKALEYGIVHDCCTPDELDTCVDLVLDDIRHCAPGAIAAVKELIFKVHDQPLDSTVNYRADLLNQLRAGEEAQEGLLAFIQKRPPRWASEA